MSEDNNILTDIQDAIRELEKNGAPPNRIRLSKESYRKIQKCVRDCWPHYNNYEKIAKNVKISTLFGLKVVVSDELVPGTILLDTR